MAESTTKISLPYGSSVLDIEVPTKNLIAVASPNDVAVHTDVATIVRQALRDPIGVDQFSSMFNGGEKLLILADDITRPTPVDEIIPVLLDELKIEANRVEITILIALGTHREMTEQEILMKFGAEIVSSFSIVNHKWDEESALLDLGTTPNGTPIRINRLIEETDFCIGIGNIVPHNLAGWSGGGKIVMPCICGRDTTNLTHLLAARCPTTNLGKLVNPVRLEIEEVANQTKLIGVINTVLDRHGSVAHVVAGESKMAHSRGVELARDIWEVTIPSLADIVLASSYPADLDFWQANKGLYAAERIVKRGGDIILLAPCKEGLSSQREHISTMEALQGVPSRELFHEARSQELDDYAALTVCDIAARCRELAWVTVVSHWLTKEEVSVLGLNHAESIEDAVEQALKRQGEDAAITVLTHGGETLPVLAG